MKIKVLSMILILLSITFINSSAQSWTDNQLEVWESVQTYWDVAAKGDVNGFLSYFDDSFTGWPKTSATPHTKDQRSTFIINEFKDTKNVLYTITPLSIWVKDDFAFVHYVYTSLDKDGEGDEKWSSGRWTDILMKKNNKWIMIGDSGGQN